MRIPSPPANGIDERCGSCNPLPRLLLLAAILVAGSAQAQPEIPQLSTDNTVASAGFFRLEWTSAGGKVELQEATNGNFDNARTIYRGPDQATVISGKPDGKWYYRVRGVSEAQRGPWSEPVRVEVAHHNLARALLFLGLGIAVFAMTAGLIIRGTRNPA